MSLYTSSEWKALWLKAQEKVNSILDDIDLKKANNDKDSIELSESRLEDAIKLRDDYENKYYQAKKEEESGIVSAQIGLTSLPSGYYGF
jgi:hypothetical protein